MYEIELLIEAEFELSEAYDWYEEKQPGLGDKFYKEVRRYLQLLEKNPLQFPIRQIEELRFAALSKFPYLVIYWIDKVNKIVFVVSIFHTSRNPRYF